MNQTTYRTAYCERRSMIHVLTTRKVSVADIHREMSDEYGPKAKSDSKVRKWMKAFKNGRKMSMMNLRAGRLLIITQDNLTFYLWFCHAWRGKYYYKIKISV